MLQSTLKGTTGLTLYIVLQSTLKVTTDLIHCVTVYSKDHYWFELIHCAAYTTLLYATCCPVSLN